MRAEGPDFSRTFVLSLPVTSVRYVRGLEFRPGRSGVIHHANIRVDRDRGLQPPRSIRSRSRVRGLLLPSAIYPDGHFLGWTPGQVAPLVPEARWRGACSPGPISSSKCTCVPSGKPEVIQPAVGLYFGDRPPERTPAMLRLGRQNIDIPAGEKEYVTTDSFVLPVEVTVEAVQPHAHYRAREVRGTATLPDGTATASHLHQGLGLPLAARLSLRRAARAAEGHDVVDALHLRQLGRERPQSASTATACLLGTAIHR